MELDHKWLTLEAKASDAGEIEGYGSVFGNEDLGGDVVLKGAFSESLKSGRKVRMLRDHEPSKVIGVWDEVEEDDKGLRVKGRFALSTGLGKETFDLVKMGAFDGLSIGYKTIDDEMKEGRRHIKQAELWEVSAVPFPMNEAALIDAVKAAEMSRREIERKLTQDAGFSRSVARSLMEGGLEAISVKQDAGEDMADLIAEMRSTIERYSR